MPSGSSRRSRLKLPIQTPRLTLRLPSNKDVRDLRRSFRNPPTARAVGAPLHTAAETRDPRVMIARTRREFSRGEHLSLSVIHRDSAVCVGRVGLRGLDWKWRKVESLSYWIDPDWWSQGIATEASWYLCDSAFKRLEMRRIASQALRPNGPPLAVLRKLGFVEEGRERQSVCIGSRCVDMVLFGLLRNEFIPRARALSSRFRTGR